MLLLTQAQAWLTLMAILQSLRHTIQLLLYAWTKRSHRTSYILGLPGGYTTKPNDFYGGKAF